MKRYWKLILVVFVIFIGIGIHYYQSATAASENPQFMLKKISGSDHVEENISVFGDFTTPDGYHDNFYIDDTQTIYNKEISYFEDINGMFYMPEIKRLQNDYRKFMRGKESNLASFYEDESHVAYMTVIENDNEKNSGQSELSFKGEVLDKKNNEVITINESMPLLSQNAYNYAEVEDVQMANGKLIAVVREMKNMHEDNETIEEYHIYTFDFRNGTLLENENLMTSKFEQVENEPVVRLNILSDIEDINPQKYILIQSADVTIEDADRELIVYNFDSSEQKKLSLGKEQMNYDYVFINGPKVHFIYNTTEALEILQYDLEEGKFSTPQTIKVNGVENESYPIIKIEKNLLYVVSPTKDKDNEAFIVAYDLNTLKPFYEGIIEQSNVTETKDDFTLHIHSMYIE